MTTTQLLTLTPGRTPAAVTDAGNVPVGCALINRGDNGGTITVTAGSSGPPVQLTPGGSLTWSDPAALPYVSTPAGGTTETLVVTDQVRDYSNPAAVAAATAVQLAQRGIPNVFTDTPLGTYRLSVSLSSPAIDVTACGSLLVGVSWPAPPPGPGSVRLAFTDPAVPGLDPIYLYCTNDNTTDQAPNSWRVPVLGPRLTITHVSAQGGVDAWVSVVGNNRTIDRFRLVGGELGIVQLAVPAPGAPTIGAPYLLKARNEAGMQPTLSNVTRMQGPVMLACEGTGVGTLLPKWVDPTGGTVHASIPTNGTAQLIPFAHPAVPVSWTWIPSQTSTANAFYLSVVQS